MKEELRVNKPVQLPLLLAHLQRTPQTIYPQQVVNWPHLRLSLQTVLHDDWLQHFGSPLPPRLQQQLLQCYGQDAHWAAGLLLALWCLQFPGWVVLQASWEQALLKALPPLFETVPIERFFRQPEHQEEFARFWLRQLSLEIEGESPELQEQNWLYCSSQHRQQLFARVRQQRRRRQAIAEAQARRKAFGADGADWA